jgi:uncharacterized protein (TIGR02646 family)
MKKLDRHNALPCLDKFIPGVNKWTDAPKDLVWEELEKMQRGLCAYCECRLNRKHIEHFKNRKLHIQETFNWNNLFGSCGDSSQKGGWNRCGIFKDSGAVNYQVNNLIKPDIDSPDDYLLFLTNGKVSPQAGLEGQALLKATETIRVFNLNDDTKLFNSRRVALEIIQEQVDALYELFDECDEKTWQDMLDAELNNIQGEEFETALRHAWNSNCLY